MRVIPTHSLGLICWRLSLWMVNLVDNSRTKSTFPPIHFEGEESALQKHFKSYPFNVSLSFGLNCLCFQKINVRTHFRNFPHLIRFPKSNTHPPIVAWVSPVLLRVWEQIQPAYILPGEYTWYLCLSWNTIRVNWALWSIVLPDETKGRLRNTFE